MRVCLVLLALWAGIFSPAALADGCWVRDAVSPDSSTVLLLCEQGTLLRSRTSNDWEEIRITAEGRLRAVGFADRKRGFVAGDSGLLLTTTDGGATWRQRNAGTRDRLAAVSAFGAHAWIAGYGGVILHSDDGGDSWNVQQTPTSRPIESIQFIDENHGWAVGWSGLVLRTENGGNTWQQIGVPGIWQTLSSVHFRDPRIGWAIGMDGLILRTRDGGITWERQQAPVRSWLGSLIFDPDGIGWIAAEYDLLRSDDGGESWQTIPLETSMAVTRVVATRHSVLAIAPGVLLARPRDASAWLRWEVGELVAGHARLASPTSVAGESQ